MLENGTVLDGTYEIIRKIGAGGTSTVYLAMNPRLNQQWVIKEIIGSADSKDMQRVLREARMMRDFDNPAIPRVVDILQRPEVTYIIMDYISGQSLAHELKTNGPQSQEVVLDWARQICNVLVYLHSLTPPIIYHDLKPGNIILKEPEHNLKLIDFGEARQCINGNAPGGGRTKEYAAPEQQKECRGNTDERTDIYCFGTTIYRLLTGKFPPRAPEPVGSIRDAFPELQISKGMDSIIRKCTQVDPDKRFQSAKELQRALEHIELWDIDYIKGLKRRIKGFIGMLVTSAIMILAGIGFNMVAQNAAQQNYEALIEVGTDSAYADKVNSYIEAIGIDGSDTRAYIKLLEAYKSNDLFADEQKQQFTSLFNANKADFDLAQEDVLNLNFEIGRMYFSMYSGENNSFRSKIQNAMSRFKDVVDYGTENYENYRMANSYYQVCDFFAKYVLSEGNVQEPKQEDYTQLLSALSSCLDDMQSYSEGDAAYTRLNLYERILDMLNVNIRGFVVSNIEQSSLENSIKEVQEAAEAESVTQSDNIALQQAIVEQAKNVLDNVSREYSSLGRGR